MPIPTFLIPDSKKRRSQKKGLSKPCSLQNLSKGNKNVIVKSSKPVKYNLGRLSRKKPTKKELRDASKIFGIVKA